MRTLHLARTAAGARPPVAALAARDSFAIIDEMDAADLLTLIAAHDRVIVW